MACGSSPGSTFQHIITYGTNGRGGLPTFILAHETRIPNGRQGPLVRGATLCNCLGRGFITVTGTGLGVIAGLSVVYYYRSEFSWIAWIGRRPRTNIQISVITMGMGISAMIGRRVATAAANLIFGKEKTN